MRQLDLKPCLVAITLLFAAPVDAREKEYDTETSNSASTEVINVIAQWEDTPLWHQHTRHSTVHYPLEDSANRCDKRNCTNGCTIGFGYNLGAHTQKKIRTDFDKANIPVVKTQALEKLAGLTGTKAVAQCGAHADAKDTFPKLTRKESIRLLRHKIVSYKDNVEQRALSEGVFDKLNSGQRAVLVALDYQNPVLSSKATHLWRQLEEGDMEAVQHNIRHHSGSHLEPALQRRRDWEAKYFALATKQKNADDLHN